MCKNHVRCTSLHDRKTPQPLAWFGSKNKCKAWLFENLQRRWKLATLRYSKTSHSSFKPKAIKKYTPRNNSKDLLEFLSMPWTNTLLTSLKLLDGLCLASAHLVARLQAAITFVGLSPPSQQLSQQTVENKKKRVRKMLHQIHKLNKPRGQFQTNMVKNMTQKVKIDDAKSFAQKS